MKKTILILLAGILLITGCVPATQPSIVIETQTPFHTPRPSRTPKPTKTSFPTLTPSIVPSPTITLLPYFTSTPSHPLIDHKWQPEKALIYIDSVGGDGCCFFPIPPRLVLYADGTLILTRYDETENGAGWHIWKKNLSRQQICQHLNTLDQVGFLEYDPTTYVFDGSPRVWGGGDLLINVKAWKSNGGAFRDLDVYVSMQLEGEAGRGTPTILPALVDTYLLLGNYPEDGFESYSSQELGLWIMEPTEFPEGVPYIQGSELGAWPIERISLSKLFGNKTSSNSSPQMRFLKLSGEEAVNLFNFVGDSFNDGDTVYEIEKDGSKKYYSIFARPLLPYERPSNNGSEFFVKGLGKENFTISCFASDGVLLGPSPTFP